MCVVVLALPHLTPQPLQRSYTVKVVQKELNPSVEVVPVADGAYQPLKATLSTILAHEV